MGCIMTPMPNHLSTRLSLFHYSSFDEWGRVGKVEVWKWCGAECGDEVEKKKREN